MIQLIRPRAKNVVVLTVTTVNLFAFVACIAVHVASFAGAVPSLRLEAATVGLVLWTLASYGALGCCLAGADVEDLDSSPRPPAVTAAFVLLGVYFFLSGACLAEPDHFLAGSPAGRLTIDRTSWRIATAFGTMWLFNLGYASLLACWQLNRRTLPRARLWPALGYHARHHDQHRRQDP